jgi:choline kinase
MQVIILAAGRGTRLGRDLPKPLTALHDGRTIMEQQLDNIYEVFGETGTQVQLVVGHGLDHIIDAFPDLVKVYNEDYESTNTSKSLMRALHGTGADEGVLWLNGDLVFDPEVLVSARPLIDSAQSFVTVNRARVADEEVKYTVDADGYIRALSKVVARGVALGEAVGINHVSAADKGELLYWLNQVESQDYFERAIELAIAKSGSCYRPHDITGLYAVEVDFEEDLVNANAAAIASTQQ